jgi:hypothetical protein
LAPEAAVAAVVVAPAVLVRPVAALAPERVSRPVSFRRRRWPSWQSATPLRNF